MILLEINNNFHIIIGKIISIITCIEIVTELIIVTEIPEIITAIIRAALEAMTIIIIGPIVTGIIKITMYET